MKEKKIICKYCHKPLEKIKCPKEDEDSEYAMNIHESVTFILWLISLFVTSYKKKLEEHKFKTTCVNEDCIGYLDGCMVNKNKSFRKSWKYP